MYFVPFYLEDQNGEPGKLRQIMVLQDGLDLPLDTYVFLENYCINKNCDCRKVMINAISKSNQKFWGHSPMVGRNLGIIQNGFMETKNWQLN